MFVISAVKSRMAWTSTHIGEVGIPISRPTSQRLYQLTCGPANSNHKSTDGNAGPSHSTVHYHNVSGKQLSYKVISRYPCFSVGGGL